MYIKGVGFSDMASHNEVIAGNSKCKVMGSSMNYI